MNLNIDTNKLITHLSCVVIIILTNIIYFYPQFDGKTLQQGDIISGESMKAEMRHYAEDEEEVFLWNNGQFSGMPNMIGVRSKNNFLYKTYKIFKLGLNNPAGIFIAMALFFYIFFAAVGLNPFLGAFLALGISLSTDNLILWDAGHNSKVRTLAFTPIIILGIWMLFEKHKYLLGGAILALGLNYSLYAMHPQMTYYIFVIFFVYGIIKIVRTAQTGKWRPFLLASGTVALAVILALGSSATRLWSLYEYNKSSMRGAPVLVEEKTKNTEAKSSSEVEGLDWEYAMSWSNSTIDLIASYIPGFAGGGSGEKVSESSKTYQTYRVKAAPLYWGELPFTEGPIYIGAVLIFLFVFGLFYVKGDLKLWLGIGLLIAVLMSMGKHFEILNKFLFDNLPLYNKFRTPQSILSAAKFFIPILGGLALYHVFQEYQNIKNTKKKTVSAHFNKSLYWSVGICGGFALLMALIGPSLFDFQGPGDARMTQGGTDISPFIADRKSLMQSDSFRTLFLVLGAGASLWLLMNKKITTTLFIGLIGGLILFDTVGVSLRYLSHEDFVNERNYEQNFAKRPVDQQILSLEKEREKYRVFDVSINTFNSASTSYWHNTIGGYHPAKLQRYQDVIERYISKNDPEVLNMLNSKYFIAPGKGGQAQVQRNPGALGNAWVVDEIVTVNSPNEEVSALGDINPSTQAVVLDKEYDNYVGDFDPVMDSSATVKLTKYQPDHLTYEFSAGSEQFVVFSEIWYGPDKGWKTYIDGEEVEHIRANYILRAMRVPAGQHKIEFIFKPKTYYTGEKITLASSLILLGSLVGIFGVKAYQEVTKEPKPEEKPSEPKPKTTKTTSKRTTSRKKKKKK